MQVGCREVGTRVPVGRPITAVTISIQSLPSLLQTGLRVGDLAQTTFALALEAAQAKQEQQDQRPDCGLDPKGQRGPGACADTPAGVASSS